MSQPSGFEHIRPVPPREQVFRYIREAWAKTGVIHAATVPTSTEYAIAEYALEELLELRARVKEAA